jgi:aspartate ammonia-lyase
MNLADGMDFFSSVEVLEDLSPEELARVAPLARLRTYGSGECVCRQHEPLEDLLLVKRGRLIVSQQDAQGVDQPLTSFSDGEFVNESSIISQTLEIEHYVTARAIQATEIWHFNRHRFMELLKQHGAMSVKVYSKVAKIISRRLQNANSRRGNVTYLYRSKNRRLEHDLLGDREVAAEAYYGVQTLRALENFDISGIRLNLYPYFVNALAMVKKAAVLANHELGLVATELKDAIVQACDEICLGALHNQFIVDMIQGGAGTSTNMNANEVIANRALEILGRAKGDYSVCHPNNHVNLSQSTNDAYPTAIKIATIHYNRDLVEELRHLIAVIDQKAEAFRDVIKMGRTQLQDAVPMTLGQTFRAFSSSLKEEVGRLNHNADSFLKINMGGTAIGTGINAHPQYAGKVEAYLREVTGMPLYLAEDLIEATADTGAFVMYSSALKRLSVQLSKICNDLRLLSSGPRAGLGEIHLPAMQPGSSIMPGKVNPVIPEVVNQIAFKVIGNDLCVTMASEAGQLELNVMEPVIVECLFSSVEMLKNGMRVLAEQCVAGITANVEKCQSYVQNSIGLVTALNPYLGYEVSTALAKEALESGRGIYELVLEKGLLTRETLDEILKPENMLGPRSGS